MSYLLRNIVIVFSLLTILFIYTVLFALNPSLEHENSLLKVSSLTKHSGLSFSCSYLSHANFYTNMKQEDYRDFVYEK